MKSEGADGFIVINRRITGWKWWHNNTARAIWLYLLVEANWADGFLRDGTLIPRGSLARSLRNMAEDCGVSVNTIRYWLKKFEKSGEIVRNTTHGYTVINVINYNKYQFFQGDEHTVTDTPTDTVTDTPTDTVTDTDRTIKQENKKTRRTIYTERDDPGSADLVDAVDLQFRQFWEIYPKKVREQSAFQAFKEAVTDHETFDRVMSALKAQMETTFAGREQKYIPYPENWLKKQSWNDQIPEKEKTFMDMLREEHEKNEQRGDSEDPDSYLRGFPGFDETG